MTDIDLASGLGVPELIRSQEHFREYKIVVYKGLRYDNIMFEGRVDLVKRVNLLYDDVERHFHEITKLTGAMAKKYVCKACNKSCRSDVTLVCDQTCSECATSPPCAFGGIRTTCEERHVRSRACFDNHKRPSTAKKRSVSERQGLCGRFGVLVTLEKHECSKRYFENCCQNREGHLCYMRRKKDALPPTETGCCTYITTLSPRKIRNTPTRPQYTYLIWSPCNSFARSATVWKTAVTACDAVSGSTRSGTIRRGIFYYTYVSLAPGPIGPLRLRKTRRLSTCNSF